MKRDRAILILSSLWLGCIIALVYVNHKQYQRLEQLEKNQLTLTLGYNNSHNLKVEWVTAFNKIDGSQRVIGCREDGIVVWRKK